MWSLPGITLVVLVSVATFCYRSRDRSQPRGRRAEIAGVSCYYRHRAQNRQSWINCVGQEWIEVSIKVDSGFRFRVHHENSVHKLLKALRPAGEWGSARDSFSSNCYVISDDREVGYILQDKALAQALEELLTRPPGKSDFIPIALVVCPKFITLRYRKPFYHMTHGSLVGELDRAAPLLTNR